MLRETGVQHAFKPFEVMDARSNTYIKSKMSMMMKEIEILKRNNIAESMNSAANRFHTGGIRNSKPVKKHIILTDCTIQ